MTTTASRGPFSTSPRKRPTAARFAEGWGLSRAALVALEVAVAGGAYLGGLNLIDDGYRMPTGWLDRTPFDSWTGPGILLLLAVGLVVMLLAYLAHPAADD